MLGVTFVRRNREETGCLKNPSAHDVGLTPKEGQREGWLTGSAQTSVKSKEVSKRPGKGPQAKASQQRRLVFPRNGPA